jgi:predicted transcriptional regulator
MPKAAVFTMELESDLRDAFVAAAEAADRPASQVVRELMRDFIDRQHDERARTAFLQRKVDLARASAGKGLGRSNDAVEADFAARRAQVADEA